MMLGRLLLLGTALASAQNITECLKENCTPQVEACTKDATCNAGINCVIKCKSKGCASGCIDKSLDQAMLEVGICADAHHCLPTEIAGTAACESISTQDKCDAQDACSWCAAAAVPSSCKKKEDAKKLPPSVFQCDL